MHKKHFYDKYKILDKKFNTINNFAYSKLVNFSQVVEPIHRWFYYQEGYSPQLVHNIFDSLGIEKKSVIFDPFSGSGTSLLTAKQLGMLGYGFEINPFSHFMIETKTENYSKDCIEELCNFKISNVEYSKKWYNKYELSIIEKLFDSDKLSEIESIKIEIAKVENQKVRNALFSAMLSILEPLSNYRKGGNGLKRKRVHKEVNTFELFYSKIQQMVDDIKVTDSLKKTHVFRDSCLNINKYDIPNIDVSIFSPPYANCFDPFEVYKIELWLGEFVSSYSELRILRKSALTSNLNANTKNIQDFGLRLNLTDEIIEFLKNQQLWNKNIPNMINNYFQEMFFIIQSIYDRSNKDGYCIIIVGNSAYANLAVPTDIILAEIASNIGFQCENIIVARNNEASSQQYHKLGKLIEFVRESILVLKK
ncbi:MAG: hypothetical protein WAR79_11275 [Melioribacteraceae bacterium]